MLKQPLCFQEIKASPNLFKLFRDSKILLKLIGTPFSVDVQVMSLCLRFSCFMLKLLWNGRVYSNWWHFPFYSKCSWLQQEKLYPVYSSFLYPETCNKWLFLGLYPSFTVKSMKGLEDAGIWCLLLMHSCMYVSGNFTYGFSSLKHEGQVGLVGREAALLTDCSRSTYVQNWRGGYDAVFWDRDVRSDGALHSAGSWSTRRGQVAAVCHALKTSSLRALLKLWQHDSATCSSLLFRGSRYLTAWVQRYWWQGKAEGL